MATNALLQVGIFLLLVALVTVPLGAYMTKVFSGERTLLDPVLRPIERLIYKTCGVHPENEMTWFEYAADMLVFSLVGMIVLYALERLQGVLPLNPQGLAAVPPGLAFNTAASFTTNTNWQAYSGETTMSYLTQMAGLAYHNFVSAAAGIAIAIAIIRGFVRRTAKTLGNFWVDVTRATLWILLPLCIVFALVLVWQGIPQNFNSYTHVKTLEGAEQVIGGPGCFAGDHQRAGHQWRRVLQCQRGASFRKPDTAHQSAGDAGDFRYRRGAYQHLRPDGRRHSPRLGAVRSDGFALPDGCRNRDME